MTGAIVTVDAMRAAEQAAMDAGTSEWELMQRAGEGAASWVARMAAGRTVCVLCGPGNNGGDGYVIAESLRRRGIETVVVAPKPPSTETARTARKHFGGEIQDGALLSAQVYVDCLFGYGLSRMVEGAFAELLEALSKAQGYKIAVDVPSAVKSDTGKPMGPLLDYDLTLALGAWKRAHFIMPAMASMGAKRLVSIGLELPAEAPSLSQPPRLQRPAADAHKYQRGLLAIVGGEMPGAALLAAEAAMRAGAGYVKLLSEHSHPDAPADLVIEPNDKALSDDRLSAVLAGPGLGRDDEAERTLAKVLAAGRPLVLDADALHLLSPDLLKGVETSQIAVTPHEGEVSRLCDAFGVTGASKWERARSLSDKTGLTVLAKGPDTLLSGGGSMRAFPQASPWLSIAGTGDVLAGMIASRLAMHGDPFRACEEGVWLHGEAAATAGPAFTASELAMASGSALDAFL